MSEARQPVVGILNSWVVFFVKQISGANRLFNFTWLSIKACLNKRLYLQLTCVDAQERLYVS